MHTLGKDSLFKQCCKFLIIESPTVFMENGSHSTMERSLKKHIFQNFTQMIKVHETKSFSQFFTENNIVIPKQKFHTVFISLFTMTTVFIYYPRTNSCPLLIPSKKPCNSLDLLLSMNLSLMHASTHQVNL